MKPRLRRPLPVALLVAPAVLLGTAPGVVPPSAAAGAPSRLPAECAPVRLGDEAAVDQRAAASDDVFAGRVVAAAPVTATGRATYTVAVRRSFRGDVPKGQQAAVTVDGPTGSPASLQSGAAYLFFTADTPDGLQADFCGGTVPLPRGLTPRITRRLERFLASVETPSTPTPTPEPVSFHAPDEPAGDPPQIGRVLASGAAVSLVGLLGLLLVARLGRRR